MKTKTLNGSIVRITSDNDNYTEWLNRDLIVYHSSNFGLGYDSTMYPMMLCELEDSETGFEIPFALYEYEFEVV